MRYPKPRYVEKLSLVKGNIRLNSGEQVVVYTINPDLTEDEKNEWAKHILAHFISADDIQKGAKRLSINEADYIRDYVLPSLTLRNGSEVSGIFGEILFSDFIEYILEYSVPRYKLYGGYPGNPNQGIDIVAYKIDNHNHSNDTVLYAEIKARLSGANFPVLQDAIDDIENRYDIQFSLALDSARRKLEILGCYDEAEDIARFESSEKPCVRVKAAGLVTSASKCSSANFAQTTNYVGVNIHNNNKIETYVIYAKELMELAKDLWSRACQ